MSSVNIGVHANGNSRRKASTTTTGSGLYVRTGDTYANFASFVGVKGAKAMESRGQVSLCSLTRGAGFCTHLSTINSGQSFLACIMNMPALKPFALAG